MSIVVTGHFTQWHVLSEFLLFIREFDVGTPGIFFHRGVRLSSGLRFRLG